MSYEWGDLAEALRAHCLREFHQVPVSVTVHFFAGDRITLAIGSPMAATPSKRMEWASGDEPKHLSDFQAVYWPGLGSFRFSPKQAVVVRVLWEALFESDNPDVDQATLLREADSDCSRVLDLFRSSGKVHAAWGKLIVAGDQAATFRLPTFPQD